MRTINTHFQVVIPKSIRKQLDISVGDKADFSINENGELVLKVYTATFVQKG